MYIDVDECAENNGGCSEHATCTNIPDSFYCTCKPGYTGDGFTCTGKTSFDALSIQCDDPDVVEPYSTDYSYIHRSV